MDGPVDLSRDRDPWRRLSSLAQLRVEGARPADALGGVVVGLGEPIEQVDGDEVAQVPTFAPPTDTQRARGLSGGGA